MKLRERVQLERRYHESEDEARMANPLIRGLYASGVFSEAEAYHLDGLGDLAGKLVLDYGCGGGYGTARLLRRGAHVVAFDLSQTRLAEAQGHLGRWSAAQPAALVQCVAEQLPFPDASFDAVFGHQILHHLDLDAAVLEIRRVLRPHGRAAFLEPLRHNPLLEGYRRLTPHLRSPTETALAMQDVARVGRQFGVWSHREFCLTSVLPALAEALFGRHPLLARCRLFLQKLDRRLIDRLPFLGRFAWETVITVER